MLAFTVPRYALLAAAGICSGDGEPPGICGCGAVININQEAHLHDVASKYYPSVKAQAVAGMLWACNRGLIKPKGSIKQSLELAEGCLHRQAGDAGSLCRGQHKRR